MDGWDKLDEGRVAKLAQAEVMTWDVDHTPRASSEVQGPIVVTREGETLGVFPFYCHPVIDQGRPPSTREHAGDLWIFDPKQRRFVGYWKRLTWQEVQHRPDYNFTVIRDLRGGTMVRPV